MKKTHISFYDEVYCEYFEVFIGYKKFEEIRDAKNRWQQQSWKDVFDESVKKSFNKSTSNSGGVVGHLLKQQVQRDKNK